MTDTAYPATGGGWHVDPEILRRWIAGSTGPLLSVSTEQHLLNCAACRADVAALVPAAPLQAVLDEVMFEIETPEPGVVEKALSCLGLRSTDVRVIASTAALRAAWFTGTVVIMLFVLVAALLASADGIGFFLAGAPLIPVAGVALAYGRSSDPVFELQVAAPYPIVRLVLLRTAWVLVTSAPLVVLTGLLIPAPAWVAAAWLAPAAGFVAVVLTASMWVDPAWAAGALAIGWVVAVGYTLRIGERLAVFAPAALVVYAALAVVAVAVLLRRLYGATPSWRLR